MWSVRLREPLSRRCLKSSRQPSRRVRAGGQAVKLVLSVANNGSSVVPYLRLNQGAMPEDEMTDADRAMTQAFQYLVPHGWGGHGDPLYVALHPDDVTGATDHSGPQAVAATGMDEDARMEMVSAQFAAAIAALGAVRAYIRYDGGNDEGFAYFDHCVLRDGSVRDARAVASDLNAAGAAAFPDPQTLADEVANQWTSRLLGQGYGAGEYRMYGAFWVDLETGLVTDDPNATPRGA